MEQMDVRTDCNHTAIFSGAQNALTVALVSLFRLGDRIAADEFTYANFIEAAKLFHLQIIPIPGDAQGMDPEALDKQCSREKISGIFLMPSCSNPTALSMSENRKKALAQIIQKHRLILLEDDLMGTLGSGKGPVRSLFSMLPDQTFFICGSTKNLCTGIRIAFAAFPEAFRKRILHGLYSMNIKSSSLDAEIITELILSGKASAILEKKKSLALKANQLFNQIFPEMNDSNAHPYAFFRSLPIASRESGARIEQTLAEKGILVQHSDRFAVRKNSRHPFLRVSLSSAGSFAKLREGLSILADCREIF